MIEKDVNSEIKTVHLKRKINQYLSKLIFGITVVVFLLSSFFIPASVSAQAPLDCVSGQDVGGGQVLIDKSVVYPDEEFTIYSAFFAPNNGCSEQVSNVHFGYVLRSGTAPGGTLYRTAVARTANGSFNGFEGGLKTTLKAMSPELAVDKAVQFTISVNVYQNGVREGNLNVGGKFTNISMEPGTGTHDLNAEPVPPVPPGSVPLPEQTKPWAPEDLKTKISGIRTIYRSIKGEPTNIPYSIAWDGASVALHPNPGDTIKRGQDNYSTGGTYLGIYAGVNYQGVGPIICGISTTAGLDWTCASGTIRDTESDQAGPPPLSGKVNMPWSVFDDEYDAAPSTPEKTFTKGFIIFPILYIKNSNNTALAKTENRLGFNVEYYADDTARTAACVKEQIEVKNKTEEEANTYCADPGNRAVGGEEVSGNFTSDDDGSDSGKAAPIAEFLAGIIGTIISWIQEIIYWIFGLVVLPLISTLLAIPTYTDNFAAVILPGWELLRNLANIFFILILLVIGLGTLFRVQGYQYKNLLLKLIFAAFMVNFSLVLTQSFLAIAETAQFQFLPSDDDGKIINVIANEIMIEPINQNVLTPDAADNLSEGLSKLVFPFFYLSLTLMAFVVFCSIAFFLVLRMIVIWILLMSSPIAIVATVIPQTKKYATQWFSYLVQYGFFVTILGFFLNVTAYLAQRQEGVLKSLRSPKGDASFEEFLSRIATNLFVMGFLLAGLYIASKTKVIGAGQLNKIARKAGKLPFDFLKGVGERGLEGLQNKTNLTLDPRLWKKGYDSYLKEREKEKEERLKKRKMGKGGAIGKIFGEGVGSATGSPEQFLENFGSGKGWKTLGKKVRGSRFFGNYKNKADAAEGVAKDTKDILTEGERAEKEEKLAELRKAKFYNKIQGGSAEAKSLSSELDEELKKVKKDIKDNGSTPELDAKKAALEGAIKKLKDTKGDVDDQALLTDIQGSVDQAVFDEFKGKVENVKEGLKSASDKNAEDKMREEIAIFKDDKRRQENGYDKFDPNGDPKKGYKDFTEEKRNDLTLAAATATVAKKSLEFSKLLKDSVETAKEQAKFLAEYKEKDVGADPASIVAQIEAERGKTDFSDRRAALLMLAAENGHTASVIGLMGYDKSADGFRKFRDDELKGQEKISQKATQALLAKLDEIHRKNGEHGLGFMTQRVGANIVYRSKEAQAEAYGQAISKQSTREFLRGPETNLFNISNASGKVEYSLKQEARERLEAMDPSEATAFISGLPPAMKKKLMKATGFNKVNWKRRSAADAQKGNKYESIIEALNQAK